MRWFRYLCVSTNSLCFVACEETKHASPRLLWDPLVGLGKFCFGDRTIPIHARTLGFDVSPHVMGVYYGTVQSAVVHTN